jgi:hypothetical protein
MAPARPSGLSGPATDFERQKKSPNAAVLVDGNSAAAPNKSSALSDFQKAG